MDWEDEEVIFENRALHQALSEMGVDNVDTEPVLDKDFKEPHDNATDEMVTEAHSNENRYTFSSNFFTRAFISKQEITSLYQSFQRNTLNRLKSSPLLSSDDRCFLASFVSYESNDGQYVSEIKLTSFIWPCLRTLRLTTMIIGMFYAFAVFLYMVIDTKYVAMLKNILEMNQIYQMLWAALGSAMIYGFLKFHLYHKVYTDLKKMDYIIKEFEDSAESLSRIQRKCVRRIRESELAARGFTLTSLSSNTNSDSPLLSQVDKWCPSFRAALCNGNLDVVSHLENSYKLLTESIPLVVDFRWLDIKPSQLSASSSSSGLNKGNHSSASDGGCEEVIPTSQLVSSQELLTIHISAFMRRLVLSFVSENCKDSEINPYIAVTQSVQTCVRSMDGATSVLGKHHSFYRAVHVSSGRREIPDNQKDTKAKSPLESFYVFVNSLDLHLQTVFRMTRDVTVNLEGMVEEESILRRDKGDAYAEDKSLSLGFIGNKDTVEWMETLKGIKNELDVCKSCHDEAVKFLSQHGNKGSSAATIQTNASIDLAASHKSDTAHRPITVICDSEPVIEDQVFEAVIGSDRDEVKVSRRKKYTAEEKAQIQQQREDLSRFKQELKAVVDHRAINQRKREEKALARTRGKESTTTTPSETDGSVGGVEGDDEGDSGSSSTGYNKKEPVAENSREMIEPPGLTASSASEEKLFGEISGKFESETADMVNQGSRNDYGGEKVSLLAAKLDSADSDENCMNPSELPWAPLLRKDGCDAVAAQPGESKNDSSHSPSLSQQLPYDENWRSSIEKTKARHWEMCEKIIQENKSADDDIDDGSNLKPSDSATDPVGTHSCAVGNDLDNSSFVDISSEDLLFYPIDTDNSSNANINNNNNNNNNHHHHHHPIEASALIRQEDSDRASSSCSSNSQVVYPKSVNPEEEGFRSIHGAYVSRHNFTASGRGSALEKALKEIRKQDEDDDNDKDDDDEIVVHPNRKRHQAGRQDRELVDKSKWVNISHVEFTSSRGNQYELYRQKDMTVNDIMCHPPIPSPDPSSSLNTSLALMAAARSKQFNLGVEEQFIDDGDDDDEDDIDDALVTDEFCHAISAAKIHDNASCDVTVPQSEAV